MGCPGPNPRVVSVGLSCDRDGRGKTERRLAGSSCSGLGKAPVLPELRPCHTTEQQVLPGPMFALAHMVLCQLREATEWGLKLLVTVAQSVSIALQSVSEVLTVTCPV